MCLILDANCYGDYLNPKNADMQPVRRWVESKGRIAYSPTEKMEQEIDRVPKMQDLLREYKRKRKIKLIEKKKVDTAQKNLYKLTSDDPHIIALAIAGGVKLLVSDDKKLGKDFKERVKGSVYKDKSHIHLLRQHTCKS